MAAVEQVQSLPHDTEMAQSLLPTSTRGDDWAASMVGRLTVSGVAGSSGGPRQ